MKSPLFDDVREATSKICHKLKECPQCGKPINPYKVPEKKRYFQTLEYPTCHLRLEVKTRNNERISWAFLCGIYLFVLTLLLGMLQG
jgi:hypothetical protein